MPARLAEARRRHVAVALDEFQAVAAFNGGSVEEALRAAVQHQRQVGYVFAGSEPTLMERMIGPKRPFYKAGPVMRLEKIPSDIFARFIDSRFTRSGIRVEPGFAAAVLEVAGQLPYDVQRLAHEVWDDARAEGGGESDWTTCTYAAAPVDGAGDRYSRAHGSGSRSPNARCCAPLAWKTAANSCRRTCVIDTGSAGRQPSRPRSARWRDRT